MRDRRPGNVQWAIFPFAKGSANRLVRLQSLHDPFNGELFYFSLLLKHKVCTGPAGTDAKDGYRQCLEPTELLANGTVSRHCSPTELLANGTARQRTLLANGTARQRTLLANGRRHKQKTTRMPAGSHITNCYGYALVRVCFFGFV